MPRAVLAVLVAAALASCGRSHPTPSSHALSAPDGEATVVRVVDGDTIVTRFGGHDERVRLIGIDTPEAVKPNTPVQCFALEASARTKALLPPGTPVRLVRDVELRDRYGRLLAYVYRRSDGLFVNLALARDGFARPFTFPPNVAHADALVSAADEARRGNRGLWSRCGTGEEGAGRHNPRGSPAREAPG